MTFLVTSWSGSEKKLQARPRYRQLAMYLKRASVRLWEWAFAAGRCSLFSLSGSLSHYIGSEIGNARCEPSLFTLSRRVNWRL